jgi:hypothetical protein
MFAQNLTLVVRLKERIYSLVRGFGRSYLCIGQEWKAQSLSESIVAFHSIYKFIYVPPQRGQHFQSFGIPRRPNKRVYRNARPFRV